MRQTCRTDHQRERVREHVGQAESSISGVISEPKISEHLIQPIQQEYFGAGHHRAETQLRDWVAGEADRDKDSRDRVRENQYTILGNLGIGNAFHAAHYGVDKDDTHTNYQTDFVLDLEETRECDADALHLTDNVGYRCDDQADDGDNARSF